MKEQWKKHDSDAKLLQNVEEGRPQPIKIELPISAFGLKQDGCCNRLITLLRIAVLFVLLLILSWTAVNLYKNYHPKQLLTDEKTEQLVNNQHDYSGDENKSSFRNKVYAILDKQDDSSSEIATSGSIATFKSTTGDGLDDENMRLLATMLKMKNFGSIRVFDLARNQEKNIQNELQNVENESLESKLHNYIYEERFHLENVPETKSENEEDVSMTEQNTYVKLVNSPLDIPQDDYVLQRLNLDVETEPNAVVSSGDQEAYLKVSSSPDNKLDFETEDSKEVFKTIKHESMEEKKSDEVIVIPSLEDYSTHQVGQDFENEMELVEVDDLEELVNGIASAIGLLEETSSEADQSNEESVAVIQEEIKTNEQKLKIGALYKVNSTEEKSEEESIAIVQEEIKNDDDIEHVVYFVDLEPISEEEDLSEEAVAVIQEEIKNDSDKSLKIEMKPPSPPLQMEVMEPDYRFSSEERSREISQEKSSLNDFDKNIGQDASSNEDKSREMLSSETSNLPQLLFKPVTPESMAVIYAKLLEPFVGQDYNLVHWYYTNFPEPTFLSNDKKKVYAAKILYNQDITEYDADMNTWINEMSEDPYVSEFFDLMDPEKQILADTFLQQQIVYKLLEKLHIKKQNDLNLITDNEAREMIGLSNANHIKSWFLATHPSFREQVPYFVTSMNQRRKLYPMIKYDADAVRTELIHENAELAFLEFKLSNNDFLENPMLSVMEESLILRGNYNNEFDNALSNQEKADETAENISEETKLTGDYSSNNENESTDDEYQLIRIQQALINAMKEVGKEYENYEENVSKYQSIIKAMKEVGEEYEQKENSEEEIKRDFKNDDETEKSSEKTVADAVASTEENGDDEGDSLKEEISSNSNQYESSTANLDSSEELKTFYNKQTFEIPAEESKELKEEDFLQWLAQHTINAEPEENEDLPTYDPFDY